jgi:hypothetical protein
MQKMILELAQEADLDTTHMLKDNFDWYQMEQIRLGLEEELDVSVYAKKHFNSGQMREIRLVMEDFANGKLSQAGFDYFMSNCVNVHFGHRQMKQIHLGLKEGLDVSSYAIAAMPAKDMEAHREIMTKAK